MGLKLHKKIGHWLIDYTYLLRGGLQMVVHQNPPKHYLDFVKSNKAAVILIPGIFSKWSFMKHLGDKISLKGHPVYVIPELGYNTSDIPSSAEKLKGIIDRNKITNVVLVAHSKGGLVGKYFLSHFNLSGNVLGMIAIASPFSGSAMAKLIPHRALGELTGSSKVIENLEKHTEVNSKILSVIPEYDNHVWAERGSFLPGASNVYVPVKGHHKVIFNENVFKIIIDEINRLGAGSHNSH